MECMPGVQECHHSPGAYRLSQQLTTHLVLGVVIISLLLLLLSLWQAVLLAADPVQGSSLQVVEAREQLRRLVWVPNQLQAGVVDCDFIMH